MNENRENHLNLYDYFGFPDLHQRVEARKVFDMEKILLKTITDKVNVKSKCEKT